LKMNGDLNSRKLRGKLKTKWNRREQRRLPKNHHHPRRTTRHMSMWSRLKGRNPLKMRGTSWDTMRMALTKAKNSKLCKTQQTTIRHRRWSINLRAVVDLTYWMSTRS